MNVGSESDDTVHRGSVLRCKQAILMLLLFGTRICFRFTKMFQFINQRAGAKTIKM